MPFRTDEGSSPALFSGVSLWNNWLIFFSMSSIDTFSGIRRKRLRLSGGLYQGLLLDDSRLPIGLRNAGVS